MPGFVTKQFSPEFLAMLSGAVVTIRTLTVTNTFNVTGGGAGIIGGLIVSGGTFNTDRPLVEDSWIGVSQAAAQDVTNAADQDSNTFTWAVTAGGLYALMIDRLLCGGANAANDYEFRFAVAAGTITGRGWVNHLNAADAATMTALAAAAAANTNTIPVGTLSGVGLAPTPVSGFFTFVPTNTTTFKMQFGNLVLGGGIVSRTVAGSLMRMKQLA